jgi:hypothetical protein
MIENIVSSIEKLINKARPWITPIPAIILACSVFKRPGLSSLMIASRVIRRQAEFGAPTGNLPDGSQNKMNALIYVMTDEIVKEIQRNCVVESVIPAGSMVITGMGANAGGPVAVTCTNTIPVKATGIPR